MPGWTRRVTTDMAQRRALYQKITAQIAADMPLLYLANTAFVIGLAPGLEGSRPVQEELIRFQGFQLKGS
jgi:peptide/nickel transport system substrate-binding protein